MERAGYLVQQNNRGDVVNWLEEMAGNGWMLVSVDDGLFYFESIDKSTVRLIEALLRDYKLKGPIRDLFDVAMKHEES